MRGVGMDKNKPDLFLRHLSFFDSLPKNDVLSRRCACKPLYEYFMKLIFVVGKELLYLNKDSLKISHLLTRWKDVEVSLRSVDNPDEWDKLIKKINKIRSKVEHNDDYDPQINDLTDIREKALEFQKWIIQKGTDYHKNHVNFTFTQTFILNLRLTLNKAEYIMDLFEESKFELSMENEWYEELSVLYKRLIDREKEIIKGNKVKSLDLNDLMRLTRIIFFFEGKEYALLSKNICPVCGGNIRNTQKQYPSSDEEPPSEIYYRVGCDKCNYIVHDETINV